MEKFRASPIRHHTIHRLLAIAGLVLAAVGPAASASAAPAAAPQPLQLDYPELQMTPLMSDRIDREAGREAGSAWTRFLPLQASAALTTTAGILQLAGSDGTQPGILRSGAMATGFGAAQLITTLVLSAAYEPYASAKAELKQSPGGSVREKLSRERYAEESIEAAARIGNILAWLTVLPNAAASVDVFLQAPSGSAASTMAAISLGGAILPLLFPTRWQVVASEQADYKKRIYGPVGSARGGIESVSVAAAPLFSQDERGRIEAVPGLTATLSF